MVPHNPNDPRICDRCDKVSYETALLCDQCETRENVRAKRQIVSLGAHLPELKERITEIVMIVDQMLKEWEAVKEAVAGDGKD